MTAPLLQRLLPSPDEARSLWQSGSTFRGLTLEPGVLPPLVLFELALRAGASNWLMPRLFALPELGLVVAAGGFKTPIDGGEIEIGYNVAPGFRGRGIATQAVALLLAEAFGSGLRRVRAETVRGNTASERVLEKAGFERGGEAPRAEGPCRLWWKDAPVRGQVAG